MWTWLVEGLSVLYGVGKLKKKSTNQVGLGRCGDCLAVSLLAI